MSDPSRIGSFVRDVFAAWRKANVAFLVLRNYEGLPNHTSNDIDVLVTRRQRKTAESLLKTTAGQHGFALHNRAAFATLALYFHHTRSLDQVHFDLFTQLTWRGLRFLECDEFLRRRVERDGFYVPHPADEAVTNLLAYAIYSGKVKEKYREQISAVVALEAHHARELLARSYGSRHAWRLVQAAAREDWEAIEKQVPSLRRRLLFRHLNRRPFWTFWSFFVDAQRLVRRMFHPPGIVIALCGPDGCGKTTAREKLVQLLAPSFSPEKSAHYHWKPPAFTAGRRARRGPAPDPQGKPARSKLLSVLFFAFHWTEFFLGSHLAFGRVAFRGGLVVIDRFYYDFFVDQKRYRLAIPQGLAWLGLPFLRQPDIAFILNAPAELLLSRKQELPLEELQRQRAAFLDLSGKLTNAVVIDASQPVGSVAHAMAKTILAFAHDRQKQR